MGTTRPLGIIMVLAVAIAGITAGCGEKATDPVVTTQLDQQQAEQMASQLAASLAVNGGWVMIELQTAVSNSTGGGAAAPAGSQGLRSTAEETTFSEGDINFSLRYEFYNSADEPLSQWDTTAVKMVAACRVWGTASEPEVVLSIGHAAELTFTGIEMSSEIVTLNGTARDTLGADFANPDSIGIRTLDWLANLSYDDVMMNKDPAVGEYPLSGTATYHVNAEGVFVGPEGDVTAGYEATAVIVFNGTQYPQIVIDGRYFYRANLVTGELIPL